MWTLPCSEVLPVDYSPQTTKELPPYEWAHLKTVERAIAKYCLESALVRSCSHVMQKGFQNKLDRLSLAGLPRTLLITVKSNQHGTSVKQMQRTVRPDVVPYIHPQPQEGYKQTRGPIVFSVPNKQSQLWSPILSEGSSKGGFSKKHVKPCIQCATGVA